MRQWQFLFYLLSLSLVLKRSYCFVVNPWIDGPISTKIAFKHRGSPTPTPLIRASANVSSDECDRNAPRKRKSLVVTAWIHAASIFIVVNYRSKCWPAFLAHIPFQTLSLLHSTSGMLFAGSIITTTLLEWIVVTSRDRAVNTFWFEQAPRVEKALVLPALTGSIVSGVAQAFSSYGSLKLAPRHVKSSLHLLFLFGLWWGVTDRKTQGKAQIAASEICGEQLPLVLRQRRFSNVVSCLFLVALYAIMVLKPGYNITA